MHKARFENKVADTLNYKTLLLTTLMVITTSLESIKAEYNADPKLGLI